MKMNRQVLLIKIALLVVVLVISYSKPEAQAVDFNNQTYAGRAWQNDKKRANDLKRSYQKLLNKNSKSSCFQAVRMMGQTADIYYNASDRFFDASRNQPVTNHPNEINWYKYMTNSVKISGSNERKNARTIESGCSRRKYN